MAFLHPSYFPFCVYEGSDHAVGDGTLWPIGMSLDECMFLYWKAKTFTLGENWNSINSVNSTVSGFTNTTMSVTGDRMSDALCTTYQTINELSGTFLIYLADATYPGPYYFQDFLLLDLFVGEPKIIKRNGLYYPGLYFRRDGGYYAYRAWSSWAGDFATPAYAYTASIRLGDLTIDPYQFSIYSDTGGNIYTNTHSDFTVYAQRTPD